MAIRPLFPARIGIWNVVFCGGRKTGAPGKTPLGTETRTNNKLNPHMTLSPGIEPGPHWWEASALTTVPSPLTSNRFVACVAQHRILTSSERFSNYNRFAVYVNVVKLQKPSNRALIAEWGLRRSQRVLSGKS